MGAPPDADSVRLPATFIVGAPPISNVVVEKFKSLNQLLVVNVGIEAPDVNVKLGAVVMEPPAVDPHVSVLVTLIAVVKPPVPDQVKLVKSAILNTVVAAVV